MTNAELISKIKAEIERRKKSLRAGFCSDAFTKKQKNEMLVASEELGRFNRFLDTLESEKPVPADLEEAAQQYAEGPECTWVGTTALEYAFIAGAKWQAEQLLKSSPMPEDTVLFNKGVEEGRRLADEEQADLLTIVALDAAQRAKEQMMKEAVEGVVCYGSKGAYIETDFLGEYDTDVYGNPGDKVRIIIVKE